MRAWMLAAALLCTSACSESVDLEGAPSGEGYTLEVRASEAEQIYVVTAPDGRSVAGRAADGASALLDADALRAFAAAAPEGEPPPEVLALRVPGFDLSIGGGDADGTGDTGRVSISVNGAPRVEVNAQEGGPGEGDDRAHVRISGVSESEARQFITKADELSPAVQAEMLAALGLE